MKTFDLVIERKHGDIRTTMSIYGEKEHSNALSLSTPLSDVVKAIKSEIGSVAWVFTQKEFDRRFDDALDTVLREIGKATIPRAKEIIT